MDVVWVIYVKNMILWGEMEYLQRWPSYLAAGPYVFQKQLNASQIIWYNKHILLDKSSF